MITSTYSLAVTSNIGYRTTNYERRTTNYGPALRSFSEGGFVLPLVLVAMVILMALIIGATMTSYGSRLQAVQTKAQTEAMLAAEAGYEQALFWMSQRTDLLGDIEDGNGEDSIVFATGRCDYEIGFHGFIGARPVFRVTSTGVCGRPSFTRVVDVDVMQETSGWAMGACRIPNGTSSTLGVNFANGEIIDMPLHINKADDGPSVGDIFISGNPTFLRKVAMGESRKNGAADKNIYTQTTSGTTLRGTYSTVMSLFQSGIDFDQPGVRITDTAAVQSKINRFYNTTDGDYRFTPKDPCTAVGSAAQYRRSAVQLEFFVDAAGVGKVRITNDCTVRLNLAGTYDYNAVSDSTFRQYNTYAYHYRPITTTETRLTIPIDNDSSPCYVSQPIGEYHSEKGGQIFVNGNVVIGGGEDTNFTDMNNMVVKGKITVVATGNIWIADSIKVDGAHDVNGMPTSTNSNVLGLIAQGVIKIVNPQDGPTSSLPGLTYQRIGIKKTTDVNSRYLTHQTVVEAALTVGGGGFGAEGVGSRREWSSGTQDDLIVHGSITEVVRGIVGLSGGTNDGYIKNYRIDTRLMSGILPGDIWFSGKYIPAPAGWHDHGLNH